MSYCVECGNKVILETSFCHKCGTKVENYITVDNSGTYIENSQNWICSNCDHENKDAKFCVKCGDSNNRQSIILPHNSLITDIATDSSKSVLFVIINLAALTFLGVFWFFAAWGVRITDFLSQLVY